MRAIKKLLFKKRFTLPQEIDEKTIFHITKRVITKEYGKHGDENIIPKFYKDKKLFLMSRSSLWVSEVMLERIHLCKQINKAVGAEVIKEIKVIR